MARDRRGLLYKEDPDCYFCRRTMLPPVLGEPAIDGLSATIDHLIPCGRGGPRTLRSNQVLACRDCNDLKGDLTEDEFIVQVAIAVASGRRAVRRANGHVATLVPRQKPIYRHDIAARKSKLIAIHR